MFQWPCTKDSKFVWLIGMKIKIVLLPLLLVVHVSQIFLVHLVIPKRNKNITGLIQQDKKATLYTYSTVLTQMLNLSVDCVGPPVKQVYSTQLVTNKTKILFGNGKILPFKTQLVVDKTSN